MTALAACPDGSTLAIGLASGTLVFWDLASGSVRAERLAKSGERIDALRCSPAGDLLAVAADDGAVTTWDLRTARPRERFDLPGGRAIGLCFTEDGSQLAVVGGTGFPHVHDVASGALVFADTAKRGDGTGFTVALSEDRLFVGFRSGFVGHCAEHPAQAAEDRPRSNPRSHAPTTDRPRQRRMNCASVTLIPAHRAAACDPQAHLPGWSPS